MGPFGQMKHDPDAAQIISHRKFLVLLCWPRTLNIEHLHIWRNHKHIYINTPDNSCLKLISLLTDFIIRCCSRPHLPWSACPSASPGPSFWNACRLRSSGTSPALACSAPCPALPRPSTSAWRGKKVRRTGTSEAMNKRRDRWMTGG